MVLDAEVPVGEPVARVPVVPRAVAIGGRAVVTAPVVPLTSVTEIFVVGRS